MYGNPYGYSPYGYSEWDAQDDQHDYLMVGERRYYSDMAEILSHGSREEVRAAIRGTKEDGRGAYDIQDAMVGADYPVDAGGFTGTKDQYQMVLDEMRRYGDETGDEDWTNAAYLTQTELDNCGWNSIGPAKESFGMRDVIGGVSKAFSSGLGILKNSQDYRAPRTGDVRVAPHTRIVNGRRVQVRGHSRKR